MGGKPHTLTIPAMAKMFWMKIMTCLIQQMINIQRENY